SSGAASSCARVDTPNENTPPWPELVSTVARLATGVPPQSSAIENRWNVEALLRTGASRTNDASSATASAGTPCSASSVRYQGRSAARRNSRSSNDSSMPATRSVVVRSDACRRCVLAHRPELGLEPGEKGAQQGHAPAQDDAVELAQIHQVRHDQ